MCEAQSSVDVLEKEVAQGINVGCLELHAAQLQDMDASDRATEVMSDDVENDLF